MPASAETIAAERKALMRVMVTHPYKISSRKLNENLLIAIWNIEQFSNRHSNRAVQYIAAICERFDIIALQEVKTDLRGLERLQQMLRGNYRILVSDPTGNHERFTFLYDKRSVVPTGLASDIGFNVPARVRAPQRGAARSRAASAVIVFSPVLIGISFRFSGRPRPKKAHNKERRARFSPDAACRRFICAGSAYHGKSRMRVRGFKNISGVAPSAQHRIADNRSPGGGRPGLTLWGHQTQKRRLRRTAGSKNRLRLTSGRALAPCVSLSAAVRNTAA